MDNPEPLTVPYYMSCIAGGYRYECSCDELHREETLAWNCRSCRINLSTEAFEAREIVNLVVEYGEK